MIWKISTRKISKEVPFLHACKKLVLQNRCLLGEAKESPDSLSEIHSVKAGGSQLILLQ